MKNLTISRRNDNQLVNPGEILLILFAALLLVVAHPGKSTILNTSVTAIESEQLPPDHMLETLETASAEQRDQTYTIVAETSAGQTEMPLGIIQSNTGLGAQPEIN